MIIVINHFCNKHFKKIILKKMQHAQLFVPVQLIYQSITYIGKALKWYLKLSSTSIPKERCWLIKPTHI